MCVYFLFLLILLMVFECTTHSNMGKTPCCDNQGLKKGAWTEEEDCKLLSYVRQHGEGGWRSLPQKAGLLRCGKSCRLRWANYLRPGIKRGGISPEEEQIIIRLHAALGNRWSAIARHLHRRTDNEIKNYWNTRLKRRVAEMTSTTSTTITTMDHHHVSDDKTSFSNSTTNLAPNPNDNLNFPKSNQERERASSSSSPPPHAHETHDDLNKSPILSHHDRAISCTTSITAAATTTTSSSVRILNKIASNLALLNLPRVVVDGSASESSSADGTRPGSSVGELSPQCGGGGGGGGGGYSSGSPASSTPSNNVDPFEDGSPAPVVSLSQQAGFSPLCGGQVQLMCQQDLELDPLEMLLSDTAAYDIAEDMEDYDNNNNDYNNNADDDDLEQMFVTSFPNGFLDQQISSLDRTDLHASFTSNNYD